MTQPVKNLQNCIVSSIICNRRLFLIFFQDGTVNIPEAGRSMGFSNARDRIEIFNRRQSQELIQRLAVTCFDKKKSKQTLAAAPLKGEIEGSHGFRYSGLIIATERQGNVSDGQGEQGDTPLPLF